MTPPQPEFKDFSTKNTLDFQPTQQLEIDFLPITDDDDEPICLIDGSGHCSSCEE